MINSGSNSNVRFCGLENFNLESKRISWGWPWIYCVISFLYCSVHGIACCKPPSVFFQLFVFSFSHSSGADIHDCRSPLSSVSCVSTFQVLFLHIFGDAIWPASFWSATGSHPFYLHIQRSMYDVFVLLSHHMPIPLQSLLLHIFWNFRHLHPFSEILVFNLIKLCTATVPSQHFHFRYLQLLFLRSVYWPRFKCVEQRWSNSNHSL